VPNVDESVIFSCGFGLKSEDMRRVVGDASGGLTARAFAIALSA
jgi:hypothetical protein